MKIVQRLWTLPVFTIEGNQLNDRRYQGGWLNEKHFYLSIYGV